MIIKLNIFGYVFICNYVFFYLYIRYWKFGVYFKFCLIYILVCNNVCDDIKLIFKNDELVRYVILVCINIMNCKKCIKVEMVDY